MSIKNFLLEKEISYIYRKERIKMKRIGKSKVMKVLDMSKKSEKTDKKDIKKKS